MSNTISSSTQLHRRVHDSLIGRAGERVAGAFDGVETAIQSLHALVHGAKLAHSQPPQLQELAFVPR